MDPNTGNPSPPIAQHVIKEGSTAAKNIIAPIEEKWMKEKPLITRQMASIGKRT
jgi:NADH dehydrogenase FAD-containing subunit